ncbi:MAG: pilus assembly protein PilY, partial [Gammaproteobacteria bacterium]
ITGGRIADLAEDASIADARRFYYSPDVSLIVEEGQAPYLALVASSGFRAHPLDTDVHDKIYMIRENDIYNAPSPYVTVTESDLFDTTTNAIGETTGATKQAMITSLGSSQGWYIDLDESGWIGEKGLAEPLILGGVAIVSTYIPMNFAGAGSVCSPQAGTGSVYYLNVTDGTPTFNLAGTVDKKREDRKTYLKRSGIPPSPSVIITEGGPVTLCIGTECAKAEFSLDLQKMYWYEVEE